MSKIRNSLGLLVLDATLDTFPAFGEKISFAEYKRKTGIDLDQLFGYNESDDVLTLKNSTKLLAIRCVGNMSPDTNVCLAKIAEYIQDEDRGLSISTLIDNGGVVAYSYIIVDAINGLVWLHDI